MTGSCHIRRGMIGSEKEVIKMDYEIVNLAKKIVVGVSATTGNADPKMGEVIGGLWEKLYQDEVTGTIKNKVNAYAIGLYSDYLGEDYLVTVGHEVSENGNKELSSKVIPAGRYAKFSVHGNMVQAVAEAWGEIWEMNLERSYRGDFEEYLNADWENADIDLYVALKEE